MANTPRLVQLLKIIRDDLQKSLEVLKSDDALPIVETDNGDIVESVDLLRAQGMEVAAARLHVAWKTLESKNVDILLAFAAEGEAQEFRDCMVERYGPFPENLDDATDRRVMLAGRITQALDFVAGLVETLGADLPPTPLPAGQITIAEANKAAMTIAKQNPSFITSGIRYWAAEIRRATGKTCSIATVKKTQLWKKTMELTGRGKSDLKPKAVSFSERTEATHGMGDKHEILDALIAEQEADFEPSPCDDAPRKVRHYKRV